MKNKFYVVEFTDECGWFVYNCNILKWVDGRALMQCIPCNNKDDALRFTKKYVAEAIARNMGGKVVEYEQEVEVDE